MWQYRMLRPGPPPQEPRRGVCSVIGQLRANNQRVTHMAFAWVAVPKRDAGRFESPPLAGWRPSHLSPV